MGSNFTVNKYIAFSFFLALISFSSKLNAQIIISEYLEGPSNDKCIELYNTSTSSVDVSSYSIQIFSNGSTSASSTINLTCVTIPSCGTYVICNISANAGLLALSDLTTGSLSYNGDDAIALFNGATIQDLFGNIGDDPGSEWSGVGNGTENEGVIRNGTYCSGVTTDPSGSGFPSFTTSNWTAVGDAGLTTLGSHSSTCCSVNTISASNVTGGPFTVSCGLTDLGTIDFTSVGTFAVGNTFTVQMSDATGLFTSPTNVGTLTGSGAEGLNPSGTINFTIPINTPTGTIYRFRIISSLPGTISTDNGIDITINYTPCTITQGAISSLNYNVDCVTGDNGSVNFSSFGLFNSGNVFSIQLSDETGSFASPTTIGTISGASAEGTDPSGTINFTIPPATVSGNGYLIQIVSTDPVLTSNLTASPITITLAGSCTPPYITSVIINSCDPTCDEGNNELVFGTTGDYSVDMTAANFNVSYGSTLPGDNLTDVLTTNPATTALINTEAGCPGTYIDATNTVIPPGASFMLAYDGLCIDALTWSGLCPVGPIYVVYTTDSDWNPLGTFKNGSTGGPRFFNSTITTTSGDTFSIDYEYNSTLLQTTAAGGDGDFVSFGPSGGMASYGDDDCILNPTVLPIELLSFAGELKNRSIELKWTTNTELNSSHFVIKKSVDGLNYNEIATVSAAGYSQSELNYFTYDFNPSNGVNYYNLSGIDIDGSKKNHGTIAVSMKPEMAFYNSTISSIVLSSNFSAEIYNVNGQLIKKSTNKNNVISFNHHGVFFIRNIESGETQKIVIP